jgi:nucleoid DNA-binding protein
MNKAELVKHLAESADVTKAQAESVLTALVLAVKDAVRG